MAEINPWEPHVAPINQLVDELSGVFQDSTCPYVSPYHGGVNARILSILANPGNGAGGGKGSGFLTIENSDPTSRVQRELFAAVGIEPGDVTPWNACPWYIGDGKPTEAERIGGIAASADSHVLPRLIALMPGLKAVLLQGVDAQGAWAGFRGAHQAMIPAGLVVESTVHPLGTRRKDPQAQALIKQQQFGAYQAVARAASRS
ncbi:MAG: uracil-DNA glycosylase [Actinobacteria bacterium]|nr:uracil-DNA glycosylase [Actinomycetota bacterium]